MEVKLSQVVSAENLQKASYRVRQNNGAPGIDGMTTKELSSYLAEYLSELQQMIMSEEYEPEAVRGVKIPKPNGGERQLGIPTIVDRMIQQSLGEELTKYYDGRFSANSYGFRPGRSAHQAAEQALVYLNEGQTYIVEIDLEKFFDRVNHDRLMSRLSHDITDKGVLRLIRKYLRSGVMENGIKRATEEGTPQGGPLSPILSNIVLDELDKELEKRGHQFVRYADDITIFCSSRRGAERVLASMTQWIEDRLKLRVNREKSGIRRPNKGQLLGFGFWHYKDKNMEKSEIRLRISSKSYQRLKEKIKKITARNPCRDFVERVADLEMLMRGWVNYFAIADGKTELGKIEQWTQARLRMCIWKQWKRVRTRIRNLRKLGVSAQKAYEWGNTRLGYWRIAHSPILNTTITVERMKERFYRPLTELYEQRRHTLMNRRDTRTVRPVV
jgi:RNA-directed DNA polymerase